MMDDIIVPRKKSHAIRVLIGLMIISIFPGYGTVFIIMNGVVLNNNAIITIAFFAIADIVLTYYIISRLYQFIKKIPVFVITEEGIGNFYIPAQFVCFSWRVKVPFIIPWDKIDSFKKVRRIYKGMASKKQRIVFFLKDIDWLLEKYSFVNRLGINYNAYAYFEDDYCINFGSIHADMEMETLYSLLKAKHHRYTKVK